MRVIVHKEVVDLISATENATKLHQLLIHASTGRHVVLFEPSSCIEDWLLRIDSGTRSAYKKALEASVRKAASLPKSFSTIRIKTISTPNWSFPTAEAGIDDSIDLLNESLSIFVENSQDDRHFLLGIMRETDRKLILESIKSGWTRILHGGGSDMKPQLLNRLNDAKALLRTFVMFDSDRRHPDELGTSWSPAANQTCTGYNFQKVVEKPLMERYWMLRRRSIESYIPRSELEGALSAKNQNEAISAYYNMKDDQRWYYNMKEGFRGDETKENKDRSLNLYDSLTLEEKAALRKGFGKIAAQYVHTNSRSFSWDEEAKNEAKLETDKLLRLL